MNYLRRSTEGIVVCKEDKKIELQTGLKAYLDHLCKQRLANYDGVIQATRLLFGFYKLTPLYVGKDLLLFSAKSMRNWDVVLINYYEVAKVKRHTNRVEVHFYDQSVLKLDVGFSIIRSQIARCSAINEYLTKKSLESVYNYGLSIEI